MRKLLLLLTVMVLGACSGVKKTQEALNTGNYNAAMNKAIKNLAENKTKKGHQQFIVLLEEAFAKNAAREQQEIAFLQNDGNPANLESIYNKYVQLKQIQERIRPLLPLYIVDEGRDARFNFVNYDNQILNTKDDLSEHLYQNALNLLASAKYKSDYRAAYDDLKYLQEINPGYRETVAKMDEAYNKGLEFVRVEIANQTQQIIPERLEAELLDFNAFGIENFWLQYHTNPLENINYDYAMNLDFMEINISPERINETQVIKERQIKDGWEYLLDQDGNVVKDSLGNKIKVDKMRTVTCKLFQFTQFKSAQIGAKVSFTNLRDGQVINSYPLSSEFVFEHIFANYQGDKRALEDDLLLYLNAREVPFPSNEQMVYDAGEDLKLRLKNIVSRYQFN
ncbi:MAG: hypothetical protein ACE37L_05235 [Allomuricauda sp.]|uniref:Lipoprotein n=1 Tax=Flagellimonas sp. MMG031 TaxID=3158549 RepID=A0AAU7MVU6_9FLAO|nr:MULTISPECIES: hypothetical protein [unclassified Allomuricauda]MBO6532148.1 hypothetical protein [Allomuricauda sp.]MBO6589119.1 hypothetical protein [Allomuricauda sp.]MBO6618744.1 hypothetical protein [Allomuricauda sp.]MBO6644657.1 hypothetical protein [Allomuricauda sp.]MBO6746557.1 hypothetical protein [Allomuricauda sp.]